MICAIVVFRLFSTFLGPVSDELAGRVPDVFRIRGNLSLIPTTEGQFSLRERPVWRASPFSHGREEVSRSRLRIADWMYRYARQARLVDGASEVHKMVLARTYMAEGNDFWAWG